MSDEQRDRVQHRIERENAPTLAAWKRSHKSASAHGVIDVAIDWEGYVSALGNWAGRQDRPTTDTDSGSKPPTPDGAAPTAQLSAS